MPGGTFGAAVDANANAWLASYGGKCLSVFDKNGKPLTPPDDITFDGQRAAGDVWVMDNWQNIDSL